MACTARALPLVFILPFRPQAMAPGYLEDQFPLKAAPVFVPCERKGKTNGRGSRFATSISDGCGSRIATQTATLVNGAKD